MRLQRLLCCLLSLAALIEAQISEPHTADSTLDPANKYLQRKAQPISTDEFNDEEALPEAGECDQNIALKWMTEAASSIYATPLITDLYSDGAKDVVLPTFVHQLEILEGTSGHREPDFGGHHQSFLHASPLLYDINQDGVRDILAATWDGEILFFNDVGEKLFARISLGPLRVRKDWFQGLRDDPIDHDHPDVGDAPPGKMGVNPFRRLLHNAANVTSLPLPQEEQQQPSPAGGAPARRHLLQGAEATEKAAEATEDQVPTASSYTDSLGDEPGRLHWKPEGGGSAFDFDWSDYEDAPRHWGHHAPDPMQAPNIPISEDDWARERLDEYLDDSYDRRELWEDEAYYAPKAPPTGSEWVWVDPHIMTTPAIADINGDSQDELVIAVSYFFDRDHYADPIHRMLLQEDLELDKYLASGVVAYSLQTRMQLWNQHLDLSTALTTFQAFAYSSPTLVDLDRDGSLEIILGTSMGFLYVLDCHGETRDGWPKQMAQIEAQVAVADLDGDGRLELVAADSHGNVAVFTPEGEELWELHLGSPILQAASLGDINGDGRLEVVVGTEGGALHALEGGTGQALPHFPFQAQGHITAEVLITQLTPGPGLQLVFLAHDGLLYMVDALTGCADAVDVGEASYSMVLADDLDANGRMDLLVTTMNGNVYLYETQAPFNPLLAWPSQIQGPNGFVARSRWEGIAVSPLSRVPRDVRGQDLEVSFEIVDERPPAALPRPPEEGVTVERNARGPYLVHATLQGIPYDDLMDGHHPVVGNAQTFVQPGRYTLSVPCPRTRSMASIQLEMTDEHGLVFLDEFAVSFHIHFHRLIKWLVTLPFAAMTILAIMLIPATELGLPTVAQGNHRLD